MGLRGRLLRAVVVAAGLAIVGFGVGLIVMIVTEESLHDDDQVPQKSSPSSKLIVGRDLRSGIESEQSTNSALIQATGFDIVVSPSDAVVSLDGRDIGTSPLRVRNLTPGNHTIGVSAPDGYFAQHKRVRLELGQAETLTFELVKVGSDPGTTGADNKERLSASQGGNSRQDARSRPGDSKKISTKPTNQSGMTSGTLMLGSKPPCDILIDGEATGKKTPQRALVLSPGQHVVGLVNDIAGIDQKFVVNIVAGEVTRVIKDYTEPL